MMLACVNVMVRRLGHEMEGARNGEEATQMYLEAYQRGRPFDLVILDVTVKGGMGGKETILILRKIDPYVKAIVSSGYSQDPIMTGYKEYGFDDALPKPYAIEDLEEVLHKLFEQ
jgi:two-component system, cell cycle sensor histidine kinase and response regulator CckA